jgi:hypothetical protein
MEEKRKLTHRERLMLWHNISAKNIDEVLQYEQEKGIQYGEAMNLIAAVKTVELKYGFSYEDAVDLKRVIEGYMPHIE